MSGGSLLKGGKAAVQWLKFERVGRRDWGVRREGGDLEGWGGRRQGAGAGQEVMINRGH